jgi:CubicO group peptidase (beta-lactamase class C family)
VKSARGPLLLTILLLAGCRSDTSAVRCPDAVSAPPTTRADALDDIDARVESAMAAFGVPGLALAVVHDDRVVLARGYGVLEQGKPERVDEHTVFAIASNTKAFVGTALGLLAAEGAIDWDDRVVERWPELRTWDEHTTRELRVRDLVSHRSGLDTWAGDLAWIGADIDTATLLERLPAVQAGAGLRERYGYTNLMFVVAGEVIRSVSGTPWDAFVRDRLLEPLGMGRTTTSIEPLASQGNVATPHMPDPDDGEDDALIVVPYLDVDAAGPAGAMNSSVADMAQWLRMQLADGELDGRRIVPSEVIAELRVPHTPIRIPASDEPGPARHFLAYGLGWFLYDFAGRLVVTHGGGLPGMTSRVGLVPEEGLGVVVLTNSETPVAQLVFLDIVDAYLGIDPRDHVARAKARASERAAKPEAAAEGPSHERAVEVRVYEGVYANALLGRAAVKPSETGLELRLVDHGGLDCVLEPARDAGFGCRWSNPIFGRSTISFDLEKGRAVRLRFRVRPEFVDPLEYAFERTKTR